MCAHILKFFFLNLNFENLRRKTGQQAMLYHRKSPLKKHTSWASLVTQWWGLPLPMQEIQVESLV